MMSSSDAEHTPITQIKVGDTVRLTGTAWDEIESISPIKFDRVPQVGEEHRIVGGSVLGPFFFLAGTPWAVNDTYTAVVVRDSMNIHDIVRELNAALGPTLVAGIAGSKDRKLPSRWGKADGPEPRSEASKRLTFAHQKWLLLATVEGDDIARQWFIGGNPRLREDTPITAIREGRYGEVTDAVESFIAGTANA